MKKRRFSWKRGIACLALSCSTCICYTENIIYSILRLKYINWLEKAWKYPSANKFALTINIHLSRTSFPALTQVASYNISVYIVWILYYFFYCFIVNGPVMFSCLINEMLISRLLSYNLNFHFHLIIWIWNFKTFMELQSSSHRSLNFRL